MRGPWRDRLRQEIEIAAASPMKLDSVLKISLDELRMQMLGSQVLFGFQFQGLFQDNFEALQPPVERPTESPWL